MPAKRTNPKSGGVRKSARNRPSKSLSPETPDVTEPASLIDPTLRSDESMFMGTPRPSEGPERTPEWDRSASQTPGEEPPPDTDMEEDIDPEDTSRCIPDWLKGPERDTYLGLNKHMRYILASRYICTFDATPVSPVVLSSFGLTKGPLFDVQCHKSMGSKDGWKCNVVKRMEAFIDECLNDVFENLPTRTAVKFAAATSRDSAKKLLDDIFSFDRFQDIFRFVHYIDIAESNERLKAWCKFIWSDVGLSVLLTKNKARGAVLKLSLNEDFEFTHKALLKRWKKYGETAKLNHMRPTPSDVVVRRHCGSKVRRRNRKSASDLDTETSTFDTSGYI
ncbi:hypothetical protein E4U57_001364 [Claviceps arundinis]|uniref:Uncharacterized protein n=1 Tax=Claviceps arundinis TaxID=1623583 RepID=A0ABQ7PKZ9_9HYPO|nr:hypothetical protein E4U57_001364 [Claviceps arundinis]